MDEKRMTFEEELNTSGKLVYLNVGYSMRPLLREGRDLLMIETYGDKSPARYDAVLFRRRGVSGRGAYVLHRILKVLPNGRYWIVGDNCTRGEVVATEDILGVLTQVKRGPKKLIRVTDFSYKLYVLLWCKPYHLRFLFLRVKRLLGRVRRKLGS